MANTLPSVRKKDAMPQRTATILNAAVVNVTFPKPFQKQLLTSNKPFDPYPTILN